MVGRLFQRNTNSQWTTVISLFLQLETKRVRPIVTERGVAKGQQPGYGGDARNPGDRQQWCPEAVYGFERAAVTNMTPNNRAAWLRPTSVRQQLTGRSDDVRWHARYLRAIYRTVLETGFFLSIRVMLNCRSPALARVGRAVFFFCFFLFVRVYRALFTL